MRAHPSLLHRLPLGLFLRLFYAGQSRTRLASVLLILSRAAVPVGVLFLTRQLVDGVVAGADRPGSVGLGRQLALLVAGIALLSLLDAAFRVLSNLLTEVQAEDATERIQALIHRQSAALDLSFYDNPAFHDSLQRAQREGLFRPRLAVTHLNQLGQNVVSLFGIASVLAYLNPLIAAALFTAALPGLWVRVHHGRRLYAGERRRTTAERMSYYLNRLLTADESARELRLFGLADLLQGRFQTLRRQMRADRFAMTRRRSLAELVAQAAGTIALAAASLWAAWATAQGRITPGDFVIYLQAFQRGLSLFQELLGSLGGLYEDSLFVANLDEFLRLTPRLVGPEQPVPFPGDLSYGLEIRDVDFCYPGSSGYALRQVNLRIRPGEIVALVGENGSGKSTLVQLICRLYDPSAGAITIEGEDLRSFSPDDLRRRTAVLFQQFGRYQLPAAENIWFGDVAPPPHLERMQAVAAAAGAHDLLVGLPAGYDTPLGNQFDGGRELSMGQWQRVALARALYRDASLLILDEPTSAMDPSAEAGVFRALRELADGRMILLITHRASLARLANRIYLMDRGQAVESGSHAELLARNGQYARLFRDQAAREGITGA